MARTLVNTIDKMTDAELTRLIISREIKELVDDEIEAISSRMLQGLKGCFVHLPSVKAIGMQAFASCSDCDIVCGISRLTETQVFTGTSGIICLPNITYAHFETFKNSTNAIVILPNKTMCALSGSAKSYWNAPETYVPKSLVDTYKSDSNWSLYTGSLIAIEDDGEILTWLDEHGVEYTPDE